MESRAAPDIDVATTNGGSAAALSQRHTQKLGVAGICGSGGAEGVSDVRGAPGVGADAV